MLLTQIKDKGPLADCGYYTALSKLHCPSPAQFLLSNE